jgi:hypothetical protein
MNLTPSGTLTVVPTCSMVPSFTTTVAKASTRAPSKTRTSRKARDSPEPAALGGAISIPEATTRPEVATIQRLTYGRSMGSPSLGHG